MRMPMQGLSYPLLTDIYIDATILNSNLTLPPKVKHSQTYDTRNPPTNLSKTRSLEYKNSVQGFSRQHCLH